MTGSFSRRSLLLGSGLVALAGGAPVLARVAGAPPGRLPDLSLPRYNLRALVRMTASLEERDAPWWYDGTIYAVFPGETPVALFRFEGMEIYWMRHLADGSFELIGNTCTFFRDLAGGQWLRTWRNPWTDAEVEVPPAIQGGGPGRGFNYSEQGIRFTRVMDQIPPEPLVLDWTFARDMVWLHNETRYPPGLPPPRSQRQSMFARQKDFANERLASLPATFSSTVHMPWLPWQQMGHRPGHLVWHAAGVKLESIAQLPREYRDRAERDHPALLTADPARAAERVLPPAH